MGTSRRRTRPAPVLAGPPRAPGPLTATGKKRANRRLVSKEGNRVFRGVCAENYSTQPCFHQVDQRTALQQLDRFNPATCLGPVAK